MPYMRICFENNRYLLRTYDHGYDQDKKDVRYIPADVVTAYEAWRSQGEVFQALFGAWDRQVQEKKP